MGYTTNMTRAERLALLLPEQIDMLERVADSIEAEPDRWNQISFRTFQIENGEVCGTTHCIAGWALHHGGVWNEIDQALDKVQGMNADSLAADLLGLDYNEYEFVFYNGFAHTRHPHSHKEVAEWLRDIARGADVIESAPEWWEDE